MDDSRDLLPLKELEIEIPVGKNRSSKGRTWIEKRTVVHKDVKNMDASLNYIYESTDLYKYSIENPELPHSNR